MTDKTSSASQPSERFLNFSEEARSKASISEGVLLLAMMEAILRMACLCCWSSCDNCPSNVVLFVVKLKMIGKSIITYMLYI